VIFKEKSGRSKSKKLEILSEHKKKAHAKIREIREKSMREKNQIYNEILYFNKKRSQSVKLSQRKQAEKMKVIEKAREEANKSEYLKRVQHEEDLKKDLQSRVGEMEALELELIKKLENTQKIQEKVQNELEATIKSKPQSSCK
jgi:hypothetical protein